MGVAPCAQAATIRFVDTYTAASPVALSGNGASVSFTHDISFPGSNNLLAYVDGVLTPGAGYDHLTDTLSAGTLTFTFTSCSSSPCTNGQFDLSLANSIVTAATFQTTVVLGLSALNLDLVSDDGSLTVKLNRTNAAGSLSFLSSVLNVSGLRTTTSNPDPGPNPTDPGDDGQPGGDVPEPASLVLMGAGVLAAALRRRRLAV